MSAQRAHLTDDKTSIEKRSKVIVNYRVHRSAGDPHEVNCFQDTVLLSYCPVTTSGILNKHPVLFADRWRNESIGKPMNVHRRDESGVSVMRTQVVLPLD